MMNLPMPEYGTNDKETINNLMDTVMKLRKELEFVLHHLDDENIPSLAGIKGDIKGNHTLIEQSDSAIALLATDVNQNKASITVNSEQVALVATDANNNKAAIEVNSSNINLKANQTTVDNLNGRIASAESSISLNSDSIISKVSKSDYHGQEIISKIEQTSSSIVLSANKIDLDGIVRVANVIDVGSRSEYGKIYLTNGVSISAHDDGGYINADMTIDAYRLYGPTYLYSGGDRVATRQYVDNAGGGTSGEDRIITVRGEGVWHELKIRDGLIKDIDDIPE